MKYCYYFIFTILLIVISNNSVASQTLIGGTWEIIQHKSVFNGETRINYERGNEDSLWDLSHIRVEFQDDGECNAINIYGQAGKCSWSLSGKKFIVNGVESEIEFINENEYVTRHPYEFIGLNGNVETATMVITTRRISTTAFVEANKVFSTVKIYPDPATTEIKLELTSKSATSVQIQITDVLGKTMKAFEMPLKEGSNVKSIDISNLANGTYSLLLFDGEKRYSYKFIKN